MNAWRDLWLRAALVLSALTPLCFFTAAFGVKYRIFSWDFGVGVLTLRVLPVLASFGLTAALIALVLSWTARPLRRRRLALISALAPAFALAIYFVVTSSTARLPPIHDISTDLSDPPGFSPTVAAERALLPGGNGLDLINAHVPNVEGAGQASGLRVTVVQKAAYPDIAPIATGASPSRALAAARGVAPKLGWVIGHVDEQAGVMEARHVEFWFGAVSDIVVRVTPADPGSVIDVRSVSRQGVGDLGANAARVRAFTREIARELSRG